MLVLKTEIPRFPPFYTLNESKSARNVKAQSTRWRRESRRRAHTMISCGARAQLLVRSPHKARGSINLLEKKNPYSSQGTEARGKALAAQLVVNHDLRQAHPVLDAQLFLICIVSDPRSRHGSVIVYYKRPQSCRIYCVPQKCSEVIFSREKLHHSS